jgi:hypothetical protein
MGEKPDELLAGPDDDAVPVDDAGGVATDGIHIISSGQLIRIKLLYRPGVFSGLCHYWGNY